MPLRIGRVELTGHRPGSAARATSNAHQQALTRSEKIRDLLPLKWRPRTVAELTARASLSDEVAAAPVLSPAQIKKNALKQIREWVKQAPPEHRESYQAVAKAIRACWVSGQTSLFLSSTFVTSLPPLPTTLTSLTFYACMGLTAVPEISGFPALTALMIVICRNLATAPVVTDCPALTALTIFDCNSLNAVPVISGCPALTELNLRGCRLTSLP
jgi:hypothetical protein